MNEPKNPPEWHAMQIRYSQWRRIRALAFPEPQLDKREVAAALLEVALNNEELCRRVCAELRAKKSA
jgi:hypothetical protein